MSTDGGEAISPHPSIAALCRWVLKLFYGELEVRGLEQIPQDRPLVYVANHVNSLVDGALLVGYMPTPPRLLGTSELWNMAILKPFLRWAAAIPVYRRHISGFDPSKNRDTFERCYEVLAAGGHIGLLPEGTSHSEPALVPIKTGVSRIVLGAEQRFGPLGTRIVPVGFTFEDRSAFRSAALVQVGEIIDPSAETVTHETQPKRSVQALTDRVRDGLLGVTLNFPSWEEADVIEQAADLYQRATLASSSALLSERVALRRAFIAGYLKLKATHPHRVEEVAKAVQSYASELSRYRLHDEQVAARVSRAQFVRFSLLSLWLLLVRLPLGLVGTIVHWIPFQAASLVGRRRGRAGSADQVATYKVLASMVFYLVTWTVLAVAAGVTWGFAAAGAALVLGPLTGGVALRLYLRSKLFWRRARGYLLLRSRAPWVDELRQHRHEAVQAIKGLVELYSEN
ncbi:MAG: 1-acyl-sn-glycerol-3-phosphate acyltransferase [Acidobacteriota bacterium]